MSNRSVLSCEHLRIQRIPNRTDPIVSTLKAYLRSMLEAPEPLGSAEISLVCDSTTLRFAWPSDEENTLTSASLDALDNADKIDVRIDISSDRFFLEGAQNKLDEMLSHGAYKDCVRYCALIEDGQTISLVLSGEYRGAFLHGSVPYTEHDEDILVGTIWNSATHFAEFHFPADALDDARDLADALEARLDVELNVSDAQRALFIDGVTLKGQHEVLFYRESLESLMRLSDRALIAGALTPEEDSIFALLRFVQKNDEVVLQTAVAEA